MLSQWAENFLERQDFYKVCVNYMLLDNRLIGRTVEGDKYEGIGEANNNNYYPEHLIDNLTGRLLLMQPINSVAQFGYPPAGTFRVIDALQKANKKFDMLIIPGNGGNPCTNYMFRRGWDYLVTHLLGVSPPKEFNLPEVSMGL